MIHRVYIVLGAAAAALAGCAFEPGGATGDVDAPIIVDPDGATPDAPPPTDGRPPTDAPMVTIDAARDAAMPPDTGLVVSRPVTDSGAIDGEANEYAGSPAYGLDLAQPGHRDLVAGYTASMRAELRAAHDATHLYLFVDVSEADPHSGDSTSTWENDAVTFYFDTNNDRSGPYGADDHEIIIDYRPVYAIYPSTNGTVDPPMEAVRLNTATGFTIEARFTRAGLGLLPPGARYGFGWGIYDDDGGGNAEAFGLWYERAAPRCASCCTGESHAEPWCDTTLLGELQFSP